MPPIYRSTTGALHRHSGADVGKLAFVVIGIFVMIAVLMGEDGMW
jgi:hypothetical protein